MTALRPLLLFFALAAAVLAPLVGQTPRSDEVGADIQVLERLAEERYAEGDLLRAAELYQEIAAQHVGAENRARSLFTAAWLLNLAGDQSRALETLTQSLELDPSQAFDASLYNRQFELLYRQALDAGLRERRRRSTQKTREATAAMRQGDIEEARSLLEAALALDDNNPSALYNRALLDLNAGSSGDALADFERVVSLTYRDDGARMSQLRAKALTSIGLIYRQQGRADDAEQSFIEATRANDEEASAWTSLGVLLAEQQRYEEATEALRRSLQLAPGDRVTNRSLAQALRAMGRNQEASSLLWGYVRGQPDDAETWILLGRIEAERGDDAAAVEALERGIDADEENREGFASLAASELARLHLQQDRPQAALLAANQAVAWDREDPAAWGALGASQLASGQKAPAIASLTRATELDPESATRLLTLGEVLLEDRQLAQAEAIYLRALTLDPGSTEATLRLEEVRGLLARERAIVSGKVRPRKPVPPKKIGLDFAGIDYKGLQLRGALVKKVNKKSPAARAGLRKGDLILWIGDYSVLSDKDFFQYLKRNPPMDALTIEYLRDGRIVKTQIQLR